MSERRRPLTKFRGALRDEEDTHGLGLRHRTRLAPQGFAGELLASGDAGYDDARALWNGDNDRRPALIARATSAEDVAAAIAFAREQQLEIAVRGGGHSFAGHGVVDDGLMIDLSTMNGGHGRRRARSRARCGGGTTWADLDAATQEHGLAVPGGVISHTGVAGLTLGGGIGWLSRKHGLSCDNLVSARVVTADGSVVTASASENPDLHWALRGGGGNFGVVTEFEFAAAPGRADGERRAVLLAGRSRRGGARAHP